MKDCTRCRFFMTCEPPKQYYHKLSNDECDSFSPVPNEDKCVCCGRTIPEGRMTCPICEGEIKMSLTEKLQAIKVKKQADRDTIAEAIQFINSIIKYNEAMKFAFRTIGYEPILRGEEIE